MPCHYFTNFVCLFSLYVGQVLVHTLIVLFFTKMIFIITYNLYCHWKCNFPMTPD